MHPVWATRVMIAINHKISDNVLCKQLFINQLGIFMKLFISYRRKTVHFAQRLVEKLGLYIQDDIFVDIDGVDDANFEKSILSHLRSSVAVLLIVSEYTFADRIHNDADWVRKEIREALINNIPIILICENGLLPPHGLPDDIKDVAKSQGINFYPEFFIPAVERLADFLVKMKVATPRSKKSVHDALAKEPNEKPIIGRNTLLEALDLLETGEADKGIFLLEELLKSGYVSNAIDFVPILNNARTHRDTALRRRTAQYDYDELLELTKRKFTQEAGLEAFKKWCVLYPELIEQLDVANLRQQITSPPPVRTTLLSSTPPPDPEATNLLRELDDIQTPHSRRLEIGQRLAQIGDPRTGIGVLPNGIPDISWCFVQKGGNITIENTNFIIKPFYVAKYLTTNTHYGAFVNAKDGYNNPEWWKLFPKDHRPQELDEPRNSAPNAPRDTISWYQSMAFAQWLDHQYRQNGLFQAVLNLNPADWKISLPPEWYWQFMAQNGDPKREFAWGAWDNQPRANTTEAGINDQSTAVGMYPHGVADCGAFDVTGNLWEWCLNEYQDIQVLNGYSNNRTKVLRGGSFFNFQDIARAVIRLYDLPHSDDYYGGCRVVLVPMRL